VTERLSRTRLALFFTRRGSLCKWDDAGILEREVALYRRLLPALAGVTFVTHGDRRDAWHRSRIEPIGLVYNRFKLPADIRGAIEDLLGDEALRRRLGAGGREHVVERFSLDRVVERELALYEELV